jgi:excinuclease ABC subunit A
VAPQHIQLRGVRVHNLRSVDLDLPHRQLIAFCGVSGSGKTSLALDTLFAEGQRRYIESFSAHTRQFLERLDKPDAERIDGIPPAIAVARKDHAKSNRATVGGATEIDDYFRLLFAKIGRVYCHGCDREVRRDSPTSAARRLQELPTGCRFQLAFSQSAVDAAVLKQLLDELRQDGFVRVVVEDRTYSLADTTATIEPEIWPVEVLAIVDRLVAGEAAENRTVDSLETAFSKGSGRCYALTAEPLDGAGLVRTIDDRPWNLYAFATAMTCIACDIEYPALDPRLFSYNSPMGACPVCEGFGNVVATDMDLVVPEPQKSLRQGAIAPWRTQGYEHELKKLLDVAGDIDLPVDSPFEALTEQHLQLIHEGVPESGFGGLSGFFAALEKRKYKMPVRVFLSRWRTYRVCPTCDGARLKPEALATRISGVSIADLSRGKIQDAIKLVGELQLTDSERSVGRVMLNQIMARLRYLESVGLGYLTLNRSLKSLSGGEAQRVTLTSALGSSLVNMLYVLDEPSVGLHPCDVDRLITAIESLRDRGNTVVVVEHEEGILRAADHIVEVGPGAGECGGRVVYTGPLSEMLRAEGSTTGDYLAGRRGAIQPARRRSPDRGWIRLAGACGNNLQKATVEFPLGVLCLVTGVSGAGKSTLVQDTLYAALCHRKRKDAPKPAPYDDVYGDGQIDEVILIDQSPIGRSPRSNPVTYIKAFDQIRAVFADTIEARTHNYSAGHFSFNVDGGRCPVCKGDGHVEIDMQFLADVFMRCDECGGTRYRDEILDVTYRGRNIAEVLEMTVREAFSLFRGQSKVQERLKRLIDVGLDYLRLGQPANTLSAGEAQRLKLAAYISTASRNRTLFLMDEPTTGLHYSDVVQLLDCFDALLNAGHSMVIVEHNLQLMKAADYIIDLGPGAAEAGGRVVVQGTPEKVARCSESTTGRFLATVLGDQSQQQEHEQSV